MSAHDSSPVPTTQSMLDDQLNAVLSNAVEISDHLENFDTRRAEIESGEREPDEWLTEDTTEEYELRERWQEGILSIERRVTFEFWFTFGGPNVWAEVQCTADKRPGWTSYQIHHVTLHGAWGGDKSTRIVHDSDPLWTLIEQEIESLGESEV